MKCPACNHDVVYYTSAVNYYSNHLNSCDLMYCKNCICFFKDNRGNRLELDFNNLGIKSYNDPVNFSHGYSKRSNFLKFIHKFTVKNINRNYSIDSWLDYGSGMGYLLYHLKDKYLDVLGVEIAEDGREMCRSNNIQAIKSLSDIPVKKKYDVISSIDSFYYSLEPIALIDSFKKTLNTNGYVVVRVSLRTWLIRLNKLLKKVPDDNLRDHFINYSYNSIVKLFCENGFEKVNHTFKESGKSYYKPSIIMISYIIKLAYFLSFGFLNFHTGVTIIFRKK